MASETFKDYFSDQAAAYMAYRPRYPSALFDYLATVAPANTRAWDCATGSGQAALGLAPLFKQVIATDASEAQIARATGADNIVYDVAAAEKSGIETASVDLIVVAQALHWFDLDSFYVEAARVLKPCGIIAAFCYSLLSINPALDRVIAVYYRDIVGPYWPPERILVDNGYRSIPFPFSELLPPEFGMEISWSLEHLVGYLGTWSAAQKFREAKQEDPVQLILDELKRAWGTAAEQRLIQWPIHMRIGRQPRA
ncbi:MAG: class I SAM-dependent methyltransferase [Deltaproteobacteria bacterium]|nr:class I SAM-dependent methyltransferase [Deltaproteobacteria bacterium]MBW2072522.1 class I SAM-dependent methyltransferase [Deltaproteobacteria bacterium]